jgi:aryl-alcohol dehydrogenase-like predicted oxidoreductase
MVKGYMITTRPLGSLSTQVSEIGFGGAAISGEGGGYGFGHIAENDAIALLHESFEKGITIFDSAPAYGFGLAEKRMGKAFADKRDKVFIVSKGGITWDDRKRITLDNRPKVLQKMLEQSLKDLKTEYIDLYMIHWPDKNVDIRTPMEYLSKVKEEGKIRAIGLSNSFPEDIIKAMKIDRVDALQNEFNLFNASVKDTIFEVVREKGLGFMCWGTLDKGILTGRVTPERRFDEVDARSWAPWWKNENKTPKYRAMERINELLRDTEHTGLELALGYVLQYSEVSTALCGMRNSEQLTTTINALTHLPGKDLIDEAKSIADEELRNL